MISYIEEGPGYIAGIYIPPIEYTIMPEIEVVDKEIRIKSMGLTRSRIVVLGENGRLYWRHIEDQKARWTLLPPLVVTVPNADTNAP